MKCKHCSDSQWVCEDHPDKPMNHDGCKGAGVPCACNPMAANYRRDITEAPNVIDMLNRPKRWHK